MLPQFDPSKVKVTGDGVKPQGVLASVPVSFVIDTREAGIADLDVVIQVGSVTWSKVGGGKNIGMLMVKSWDQNIFVRKVSCHHLSFRCGTGNTSLRYRSPNDGETCIGPFHCEVCA